MTDQPLHEALGIDPNIAALVATVGGGGKTTLLFALAAERATAATRPAAATAWPVVFAESHTSRTAAIEHAWTREKSTIVVGSGRGERDRVRGVEPDWPRAALAMDIIDLVAVEADGAAGRPFKAPAEHEPVLPLGVSLVVAVVGVGALGLRIDAAAVHRPERIRALLGSDRASGLITPRIVGDVLADPNGGRKAVPDEARFAVVVSSAARDPDGAASIAEACKTAGIDLVVAFDARSGRAERL